MSKRVYINTKCPLCGKHVDEVPPAVLLKKPHQNNAELVITKRGLKQYIHTTCWYGMIKEHRPYDGALYM